MIYYGFDPGKSTGVVAVHVVDKKIAPVSTPQNFSEPELFDFLNSLETAGFSGKSSVFVVEGFWLEPYKDPKRNLAWDPMIASQMIGAIRLIAFRNSIPIVVQKNSDKPVGYGWANLKYTPGKKGTHWQDAMAHVVFYLVKNKIALPVS